MDVAHDRLQPPVHFVLRPSDAQRVLALFQAGDGHAPGVRRLARREEDLGVQESSDGLRGGRHVGAFGHRLEAVAEQRSGVVGVEFVLGRAGHGDVARHAPRPFAPEVGAAEVLGVLADAPAPHFLQVLQPGEPFRVDAVRVVDEPRRIGSRHHLGAEFGELLDAVEGHVAGAGDHRGLASHVVAAALQHLAQEVRRAVAGCLLAHQTAAEGQPLAGEDAREAVAEPQVGAEQIADLAGAHADVARRHVGFRADVAMQFAHHRLAEAHHFVGALAARVEVRAALGAAHRQAGEAVLEDLLEAEELEDALGDRGMEAQAALVRADGVVELHPPGAIDAYPPGVVQPRDAKDDDAVRLRQPFQNPRFLVLGIRRQHRHQRFRDLVDRLVELRLARIAAHQAVHERGQARIVGAAHQIAGGLPRCSASGGPIRPTWLPSGSATMA